MPDIVEITKDIINVQVSGTLLHDPVNISVSAPSEDPVIINVNDSQASVITVNGRNGYVTLNPSDIGLNSSNVVYTTGTQNISGYKNFNQGLQYKNSEVATLNDVNFTKYTYDRTVIQLGYGNYVMGWTPTWDQQIATGRNIQVTLNNLNLTISGPSAGLANIYLPVSPNDGDRVRIIANGINTWTLNIYSSIGLAQTVLNTDPINKRFIEFVYNNTWKLNPIPWHLHSKAEISDLEEIPNIESGYFYRQNDAQTRDGYFNQARYQVILSSDTRLYDSRRVNYRYIGNEIPPTPYATGAYTGILGDLAYDGVNLYMLIPIPGGQEMKWGRTPVSIDWK